MNIPLPFACMISVRETGSNNAARIMGEGITASSTSCAQQAAESALAKLIKRNRWSKVDIKLERITSGIGSSMWRAIVSEQARKS